MKAVFALGALLLIGCGKDCADVPCTSYVQVNFSSPLTSPGRYQFDVVADDAPMQCVVHVPARTDDVCDDALGLVRSPDEGGGGAGGAFADPDGIVGMGIIGVYGHVTLAVTHGDAELGDDAFDPEYRDDDSCGGCPMAEHELELDLD